LSEAPDVVLLDVYMPGLSGVGALPTIVALAPNAKVIMISGAANEDVLKRSLAFGAHDYVTKPFEISSLSRALETALPMRRLESGPSQVRRKGEDKGPSSSVATSGLPGAYAAYASVGPQPPPRIWALLGPLNVEIE